MLQKSHDLKLIIPSQNVAQGVWTGSVHSLSPSEMATEAAVRILLECFLVEI